MFYCSVFISFFLDTNVYWFRFGHKSQKFCWVRIHIFDERKTILFVTELRKYFIHKKMYIPRICLMIFKMGLFMWHIIMFIVAKKKNICSLLPFARYNVFELLCHKTQTKHDFHYYVLHKL